MTERMKPGDYQKAATGQEIVMSEEFNNEDCRRPFVSCEGDILAYWDEAGKVAIHEMTPGIEAKEMNAFLAWVKVGPPEPQWRITRLFDEDPSGMSLFRGSSIRYDIHGSDVEKVSG